MRRPEDRYKFAVITKVPAPPETGNMACNFEVYVESRTDPEDWRGSVKPLRDLIPGLTLQLRTPVFQLGEILILNSSGREPGYPGRKPGKWDVEYEEFDQLEDAIALSRSTTEAEFRGGSATP